MPQSSRNRVSLGPVRRPPAPAASSWPCCLGCWHRASGLAAVHSARTTAVLPPESWCDAIVKVLTVRLAALLGMSGASAPPSAAERRLMVWPPGARRRLGRTAACSF